MVDVRLLLVLQILTSHYQNVQSIYWWIFFVFCIKDFSEAPMHLMQHVAIGVAETR
jgi:hypothetical protein